ncbi:MAG: ATP-binding protein [Desulfobulbaceae bacterium]|nr:ATP-binding protein [Desulfobulbaceae bacterium]
MVRQIADQGLRYLTHDDELTLLAAREDPVGMIRNLDRAVIGEIQRAPQLLLAMKKTVDEDRSPGRFLLTGSANLLALPTVADSLAGRMETLTLLPLSQSEIHGATVNWLDSAFGGNLPKVSAPPVGDALIEAVLRGGYPEIVSHTTPRRARRGSGSTSTPTTAGQVRSRFGNVLETFVYGELLKHATTADGDYQLLYYRDHDQFEVDVVVENTGGQLVGVEIKSAATVKESDLLGLKRLANIAGDQFKLGVILYDGTETMPFGNRLCAAQISTLWGE